METVPADTLAAIKECDLLLKGTYHNSRQRRQPA